ncbi:MAG: oligosaccharide flippase family protein, partial [bacterium]|nr:oligosaccharide flippase family protein [bacterium]
MKFRGPAILTLVLASGQIVGLFRTLLVARFLGTEIQGESIAIGLLMGLLVSMIAVNGAWQLVQSHTKDIDGLQSTLQGLSLLRGIAAFILLATIGPYILDLIDQPELRLPLLAIAITPLLEGLTHLDAWRELREKRYRSLSLFQLAGPIGGTIVAVFAVMATRSIWAIVIIAVGTSLSRVIGSHLVAKTRFSLALRSSHIRSVLAFWAPLIPAGLLFWVNSKSDQILMFAGPRIDWLPDFSLSEIGAYGTVAGLILLPRGTLVTAMKSVLIPRLSEVRYEPERLRSRTRKSITVLAMLTIAITGAGIVVGDAVFRIGLGAEFDAGARVAPILIAAFSVQLLRSFCYESSIAAGRTSVQLVGNVFRLSAMGIAVFYLLNGRGIEGLAYSVLWGEVISSVAATCWLMATG